MLKVLIIDDQQSIISGLSHMLNLQGFAVSKAFSVEEAYPLIDSEHYDFIISDLKLPGLSGIDLAKDLYQKKYPAKIILISAYFTLEDAFSAFKANVCDLFAKPFNNNDMVKRIKELHFDTPLKSLSMVDEGGYHFLRGIQPLIHAGNYYKPNDLCWKYYFKEHDKNYVKGVLSIGLIDEEWGAVQALSDVWMQRKLCFDDVKEFLNSSQLLPKKWQGQGNLFFLEINLEKNVISYLKRGKSEMAILEPCEDKAIAQIYSDESQINIPLNERWLLLFSLSCENFISENRKIQLNSNDFIPDNWAGISDKKILNLFEESDFIGSQRPFISFSPFNSFEKRQIFKKTIRITNENFEGLEAFFRLILETFGATLKFKVKFMCVVAEILSCFKKLKIESKIYIEISILSKSDIKITFKGEGLSKKFFKVLNKKDSPTNDVEIQPFDFNAAYWDDELKLLKHEDDNEFFYEKSINGKN